MAAVLDLDDEAAAQRVDHRDADAVQAAGDLVAAAPNLPPACSMVSAMVTAGSSWPGAVSVGMPRPLSSTRTPVRLEGEHDPVAVAGQRLVDRVVDDLPDQVVQPALTGRTDVHARALAHRLEALEHLDGGGVVLDALQVRCSGGCLLFSTAVSSDTHLAEPGPSATEGVGR